MTLKYCSLRRISRRRKREGGFTLAEVVIALAILAVVIQGVVYGYVASSRRAEWSAHSLAAQSLASQGVEQARAAKWDPQAWPTVDELPPTNFVQIDTLDIPIAGEPVLATNFISITVVSTNPQLREIRSDCVWAFINRGLFTNTVITLRAPDQ
jgi:prepilin-type N-terminal cleavage/methylation domain-containing protein